MSSVRLRLDLAYDGTDFAGWARQPGLRTVQEVLEDGLARVLSGTAPRVTVAGRTDAGVHARGQVAHVDLDPDVWARVPGRSSRTAGESLQIRLTGVLPRDVVVHRVAEAAPGFDARFSALRRLYAYRVCDDPMVRDPLRRWSVLWNRRPLDVDAMHAATQLLLGRHDFAAFCKPREGATTIRTLERLSWTRLTEGADAGLLVARVQADAFCHSMVRALVGASLEVGEGRRPVTWPAEILSGRRRDSRSAVAPALGLTLEEVTYPPDDEVGARADLTRAVRSSEDVDPAPVLPNGL